jgi:hypothetical protein
MKAAELGIKSALILDNAMGWWEKLLAVHDPLTTIENTGRPILTRHYVAINNAAPALVVRIKALESLAPRSQAAGRFDRDTAGVANPEYPFFTASVNPDKSIATELNRPETFFDRQASLDHYDSARSLLELLPTLYADIATWAVPLPPSM